MKCPSTELLLALVSNSLPAGEAESLQAHLDAGCIACQRRLRQLREILPPMAEWMLRDPPAWLLRQALALFDWWRSDPGHTFSNRVPGILVADSFGPGPVPGVRHRRQHCRQLLFRAGDYDVDLCLRYSRLAESVNIVGQASPLGDDPVPVAGAEVELVGQSEVAATTTANQFGWFCLPDTRQGIYDLRIRLKREEIQIIGLPALLSEACHDAND